MIIGNDRAVKFYKKCGYVNGYTLKYYSNEILPQTQMDRNLAYSIRKISFEELETFRNSLTDCHINWQSDIPYYAGSTKDTYLAAFEGDRRVAAIAMSPSGKVNFLMVDPQYRNQGIGRRMLQEAASIQKPEKLMVCFPNNALLEGFLRKTGFEKDPIEQYEMYLPL